jgi:hypothetical protein
MDYLVTKNGVLVVGLDGNPIEITEGTGVYLYYFQTLLKLSGTIEEVLPPLITVSRYNGDVLLVSLVKDMHHPGPQEMPIPCVGEFSQGYPGGPINIHLSQNVLSLAIPEQEPEEKSES